MADLPFGGTPRPVLPSGSSSRLDRILIVSSVLCLAAVVFLAKATESTLPATDAATHADLALNATAFGLIPRLPLGAAANGGHWGAAGFNDHPFPFFYLSGWVMRYFGPDAWSAKLLPCLFSIGCVGLTLALGAVLRSLALGVVAALILTLSREFIIDGVNSHLDNGMIFFILASFIAWLGGRRFLAGALAGMGIWFKTPVALLLYPAMGLYHLVRLEIRSRLIPLIESFILALFVGSLVWIISGWLGGWALVRDYWVRQLWGTAVGGRGASQPLNPLAFVSVLRSHYMPWTLFLILSLAWNALSLRFRRAEFLVPFTAATVVIGAISLIRFKYDHYFVPAYPFLALIGAQPLCLWVERHAAGFYRGFTLAVLLVATVILCSPINPSPESFPALRRFMAIIQSFGGCQDRVLFVNGYQPYAEFDDYEHLIHFYTGRGAVETDCRGLPSAATDPSIKWILVSGGNYPACLTPEITRRFPYRTLDGNQALLGQYGLSTEKDSVDLTPLSRELKAATDCKPAPLPRDRYHGYFLKN